ncbi:Ubiquinone/menaquinone biosynthesis C-methyltransferase UbiE [uncultured archaeon]|nr:Ubiquinone/menaquinone biosynthesis C-methyltransferase UbiE [uncultured archaeon]
MEKQLLYKNLAKYYDLVYSMKDYKDDSRKLMKLIKRYKKSDGKELLEVACGTGNYLQYLKNRFNCIGTDINAGMLRVARQKAKGVPLKRADMTKLNLNKKFDVIVCLFSSIGYVKTYPNLKKTLNGFYKHLKPGGIAVIEPWFTKATFRVGSPHSLLYDGEDIKIARLDVSAKRGNVSILDLHFLVAERNKGTTHFIDRHELGLFEISRTLKIMKEVGFKPYALKKGAATNRGTYVCVRER